MSVSHETCRQGVDGPRVRVDPCTCDRGSTRGEQKPPSPSRARRCDTGAAYSCKPLYAQANPSSGIPWSSRRRSRKRRTALWSMLHTGQRDRSLSHSCRENDARCINISASVHRPKNKAVLHFQLLHMEDALPQLTFRFSTQDFRDNESVASFFGGSIDDVWIIHRAPNIFPPQTGMKTLILKNTRTSEMLLLCLLNTNKLGYYDPEGVDLFVALQEISFLLLQNAAVLFGIQEAFEKYLLITENLNAVVAEHDIYVWALRIFCYGCTLPIDKAMTDFCCHCHAPKCVDCLRPYDDGRNACRRCFSHFQ